MTRKAIFWLIFIIKSTHVRNALAGIRKAIDDLQAGFASF
jgi:hypothetical protein